MRRRATDLEKKEARHACDSIPSLLASSLPPVDWVTGLRETRRYPRPAKPNPATRAMWDASLMQRLAWRPFTGRRSLRLRWQSPGADEAARIPGGHTYTVFCATQPHSGAPLLAIVHWPGDHSSSASTRPTMETRGSGSTWLLSLDVGMSNRE